MQFYPILFVLHVLFAVIWLADIPANFFLTRFIEKNKNKAGYRKLIYSWLKLINFSGMAGMGGVLLTGIILTIVLPYYEFFQFTGNHWLTTKQVISVIIILIVAFNIIPIGKKIRLGIENELESDSPVNEELVKSAAKITSLAKVVSVLVLLNFLLAITRRFMMG